jgi:hypothetical protein
LFSTIRETSAFSTGAFCASEIVPEIVCAAAVKAQTDIKKINRADAETRKNNLPENTAENKNFILFTAAGFVLLLENFIEIYKKTYKKRRAENPPPQI